MRHGATPELVVCPAAGSGAQNGVPAPAAVTVFLCSNCARPAEAPTSAGRPRPRLPDFCWPWPVQQVVLPCTGRLQPEMLLKAFESGTSLVSAIACAEDNCHYLEGSKRCERRVAYLRKILDGIGLGAERLLLFHLPGTAAEDMALGAGLPMEARAALDTEAQVAEIRDEVIRVAGTLPPNPMHGPPATEEAWEEYQEIVTIDAAA